VSLTTTLVFALFTALDPQIDYVFHSHERAALTCEPGADWRRLSDRGTIEGYTPQAYKPPCAVYGHLAAGNRLLPAGRYWP
jgi:hypothetical protein